MKIVWTDLALEDLEQLFEFYKKENPDRAVRIYNTIVEQVDILADFPNLAQIEPLLGEQPVTFRSLVTFSGLIKVIYYVKDENINITHIWDCRRNPASIRKTI
ncbi:MAG: type II toxin-antitoxin system RelE/ParE family toxin [Tannerellaceae bacterium]|nr:type II toxin-antitoxin system RelE/ParE family toxin [Tannerellaceae bacterium]MCD8264189.1 type II toxin-antitoxin system RelE/ParE family toxin [Tannerellaceae bacterium]